jgi:hypothetical protein
MRPGCVVRVESIEQDSTTSLARDATWAFPMRGALAGTCDRERSRGEVSSWDEALGWEVLF